ncbi:M23 family metallopeptidase [Patescibacteria group bacterium]|nr:M23 family metallopeptidase [Patescibacteria group bacterium]
MAAIDSKQSSEKRIPLKELSGVSKFSREDVARILSLIKLWIYDFHNKSYKESKVSGGFRVNRFSGEEFDLSTYLDIISDKFENPFEEPHLFISDLINFVDQLYHPIPDVFIANENSRNIVAELGKLGSVFELIGVYPDKDRVSIEDLQRMEDFSIRQLIVKHIEKIEVILDLKPTKEEEEPEDEKDAVKDGAAGIPKTVAGKTSKDESPDSSDSDGDDEIDKKLEKEEPPLKISELDPQSKLYLQSLSIITINQALGKYFNEASLAKYGFPPGTRITFDQLPLEVRRQLMDRAFLQVENLLLSGNFTLEDLIKNPAQRISFSSQASLGLLMDPRGLNLLNGAIREITTAKDKVEKIKQNQEEKAELNSKKAEEVIEDAREQAGIDPNFAKNIESELNIVQNESRLDEVFFEKLSGIASEVDQFKIRQAIISGKAYIEVLIQQGVPPEYIIPDPRNFDYNRFVNIFGNNLDATQFNAHKEEIANLIIFYWKRKRAIWTREFSQEFGLEKYTPEEAQRLFDEISKDPEKRKRLEILARFNLNYGGSEIASQLVERDGSKLSEEMKAFREQQEKLIKEYLKEEINKLSAAEQQETFAVWLQFYQPGSPQIEYSVENFYQLIDSQSNSMDFSALAAAEAFGAGSFNQNGSGWMQNAFAPGGDYQGTGLMDSAAGQAGKKLATKAIGEGLYVALDAAGGWGEVLRAAETAAPWIKKLKEKIIEQGLEKVLESIKKYWPVLLAFTLLAALGGFLAGVLAALATYYFLKNGLAGIKNLFTGTQKVVGKIGNGVSGIAGEKASISNQAIVKQNSIGQLSAPGNTLATQLSPAMITAGQAVIATFTGTALLVFMYQTSLNSAFLTDFPKNETDFTNSVEKTSKYAEISKTAKIKSGCPNPESNDTKCENPSFPVTIEYTITIKPKEDFTIQITDLQDKIKFKQSKKGWEDAGTSAPSIENEKKLEFDYFKEIIKEQGGLTSENINITPTPTPGSETTNDIDSTGTQDNIIIPPGSELTFTYSLENLGTGYNHTAIINTIEANFYYQNGFMSGMDNMITASRVCLGDCSAGAGCWPTNGILTQLPFGVGTPDADASHRPPLSGGYSDAYDIGGSGGHPNVYVPFPGDLCFKGCSDTGYGCYFTLTFDGSGSSQKLLFAHFEQPNSQLPQAETCMVVDEGFLLGPMGTRGNSTGVHLHYEIDFEGQFYHPSSRNFSILETLVPETDKGNYPPVLNDGVSTCYE